MADIVQTQTIINGQRNVQMTFSNFSDGTGETGVTKVDVSAFGDQFTDMKIMRIDYATTGMNVEILWEADTNQLAWVIPANADNSISFEKYGGLVNPKTTGWTGNILFTTNGASSGDVYMISLYMNKRSNDVG